MGSLRELPIINIYARSATDTDTEYGHGHEKMNLESAGIIIELRPFGERDLIGRIFTDAHGVLAGIFKAGRVAKTRPMVGQMGRASWNARLDVQLGSFHFENEKNLISGYFGDPEKLKYANAATALLSAMLPERERYDRLFAESVRLLLDPSPAEYLGWELILLSELGYGLAIDRCGNCGRRDGLCHISPKTGRAICAECGKDYKDRLFDMPPDLAATGYFLGQIGDIPPARKII